MKGIERILAAAQFIEASYKVTLQGVLCTYGL